MLANNTKSLHTRHMKNAFIKYLEALGDHNAAEKHGVHWTTARSWRQGVRSPGKRKMSEIVETSPKRVTYGSIIQARQDVATERAERRAES